MTPNEWWKEEPYAVGNSCDELVSNCNCYGLDFNIPLIIEEVKRREIKTAKFIDGGFSIRELRGYQCLACKGLCYMRHDDEFNYCPICGAKFE